MSSSIKYTTLANYSPKGKSELSKTSQLACYGVKSGRPDFIEGIAGRMQQLFIENHIFHDFFGDGTIFIPIPGSAPLFKDQLWAPKLIAEELVIKKLGDRVVPCLERFKAVPKSSFALPGQRTTVREHFNSMTIVSAELFKPKRIVLVDDVLTKGRTIFASFYHVKRAFPDVPIYAFAPMRTQGLIPDISSFIDPSVGVISWVDTDVNREP